MDVMCVWGDGEGRWQHGPVERESVPHSTELFPRRVGGQGLSRGQTWRPGSSRADGAVFWHKGVIGEFIWGRQGGRAALFSQQGGGGVSPYHHRYVDPVGGRG